ncbi:aspartic protein-like protein 1 [Dorcoceras hygrometricum]|uniref:Aspartic protein-like protein 1 n=1 Tax=Dorcoceras hygrometricum TaxID=472368 RepID=A0A2Z7BNQ0_9LAMI|nr:aspartic protein-like protein 1 [Dorcoceras hygrometricum]
MQQDYSGESVVQVQKGKTKKCTTHSSASRKSAHYVEAGVQAGSMFRYELMHQITNQFDSTSSEKPLATSSDRSTSQCVRFYLREIERTL